MPTRRFWASIFVLAISASAFGISPSAFGQEAEKLDMVSNGAMPQLGGYMPQRLEISPTKPDSIKKLPPNLQSPMFGILKFRLASGASDVAVVLDAPAGGPSKIYVDANGNGDLTDDPAVTWKPSPNADEGSATLKIGAADAPAEATVVFYHFHDDPARAQFKNTVFYYRDYARMGKITLAGKSYQAALTDDLCTGDFRGRAALDGPMSQLGSGVFLVIDTNSSGKLEMVPGKRFDAGKPFNVAGITYELRDMTPDGQFNVAKSAQSVAEVKPPPNLSAGQPVLAFDATTMDGKAVHFPEDYKGRIVLLDFWATWCGPCMSEVPGLAAAYEKFHSRGFDVLGISLDQPDSADKVKQVTAQNKMTWPEVYDGKYWQAAIATLYGIESIPHPILVDGDTGKIITADESDLRGDALAPTLDAKLTAKFGAAK